MNPREQQVVIIGSGLAGIAAAIRLRRKQFQVVVLEKSEDYGGKLGTFSWNGFRWDKGPSLFTDPEAVDELFVLCGENPRDHFNYSRHHTSCTYYFPDKQKVQFHADRSKLQQELTEGFDEQSAALTMSYLDESERTYEGIGEFFITHPKPGLRSIFRKELLVRYPQLLGPKLRKTLHRYNQSKLKNEKLVRIFDRFGTYNGSDPHKMSGLYSMIPHLEQNRGTYLPQGGMRAIVDSLYSLATRNGVVFHFGQEITSLETIRGNYVIQTKNQQFHAGKVVCAIDHLTFYRDVLRDATLFQRFQKQERSTSALVFYWAVDTVLKGPGLHSILFGADYRSEFEGLFGTQTLSADPTIYIHISSEINTEDAPEGARNWFVMINTPAGVYPTEEQKKSLRQTVISAIDRQFDCDLKRHILFEQSWDAKGIEADTGSVSGSLYGASSNGKLAALKRHGNSSGKYPNLYFCGGTVHPGGGIPLVLKSAAIIEQLIADEN